MLDTLHIENLAIIDKTDVTLSEGLNVLTGETGAGKSILIGSINMLLGERSSRDFVRHGTQRARLQALFSTDSEPVFQLLDAYGLEAPDGEVLISREISQTGKSTCRIGAMPASSAMLRDIGQHLINIHGQHDNQALLSAGQHIIFLDRFAGKAVQKQKERYTALYESYVSLANKIETLTGNEAERLRRIEYLQFQCEEIQKAALIDGEEQQLREQQTLLANAEHILQLLSSAYSGLYDGDYTIYDGLSAAAKALEEAAGFAADLRQPASELTDMVYAVSDIASRIRAYRDNLDFDPAQLTEIEERLSLIFDLERKYGNTISDVLAYYDQAQLELSSLTCGENDLSSLTARQKQLEAQLREAGEELSRLRNVAAKRLETLVSKELSELDMERTVFSIYFQSGTQFLKNGLDQIEFLISTSPGEPPKPLTKIASGGELSRIMLALKTVLADSDDVETLIFDEIDTGVSGRAAGKIAQKLCQIARKKQVVCITHLAQIAAMADSHYLLRKNVDDNGASTEVCLLSPQERTRELARMIGGVQITEKAISHAEEMLAQAQAWKRSFA